MIKQRKWRFSKHAMNYMGYFWALVHRLEVELWGYRFDLWIFKKSNRRVSQGQEHFDGLQPHDPNEPPPTAKPEWVKQAVGEVTPTLAAQHAKWQREHPDEPFQT